MRQLARQLKDLSLLGLDFNLEVTGFEMGEIDLRIASLEGVPEQDDPPMLFEQLNQQRLEPTGAEPFIRLAVISATLVRPGWVR